MSFGTAPFMMMNKTDKFLDNDTADALFDDEATVQAQPVVPLADAPEEMTIVSAGSHSAHAAPSHSAARRPWLIALVLVSALAGAVVGGAALYIVQGRRAAEPQPQTSAPAPAPQPADVTAAPPADNAAQPKAPAQHEAQATAPAETQPPPEQPREAAPRTESEAQEHTGGRKHGKKGENVVEDDTPPQTAERRRGDGTIDTQAPIPDDASPTSIRAARVEEALRRIEDRNRGRRARRVDVYRPQ